MYLFSCYYYTDGCHWSLNWSYVFWSWKLLILHKNQKRFLLSPVYKLLKSIFAHRAPDWRKPATISSFSKQTCLKYECEIHSIANNRKTAKNEQGNDDSDFLWAWYSVYKKLGQFFPYLLTCLKKQISSVKS